MTTRRFVSFGLLWMALVIQLSFEVPAWSQEPFDQCPPPSNIVPIEVLTFTYRGTTCGFGDSGIPNYDSPRCTIPGFGYSGPDAIFKVSLHEGNRVAFRLTNLEKDPEDEKALDLVLALLGNCGNGASCVSNSTDFIGPHDEEISEAHYTPDDYYLYVDSVGNGRCGRYELEVTGVNPTPDLEMKIDGPEEVTAGREMTYKLTVENKGELAATGVEVTQTLPNGVTLYQDGKCGPAEQREMVWRVGNLSVGDPVELDVKVCVKPDTRSADGHLTSIAKVTASEGERDLLNNTTRPFQTLLNTEVDLSIENHSASRDPVVAGESKLLTYTFSVKNHGPSDANDVKITDHLPNTVTVVGTSKGCKKVSGSVLCTISKLRAGDSEVRSVRVNVKSSALDTLDSEVRVSGVKESEDISDNNFRPLTVDVNRITDLFITKATAQPDPVAAGEGLTYEFTVNNAGDSDSTGAKLRFKLPPRLTFDSPQGSCSGQGEKEVTIVCDVGPIVRGSQTGESVEFTAHVPSSEKAGVISGQATVTGNEGEPDDGGQAHAKTVETFVKVEADLRLTMTEKPASGGPPVNAGENLLYTMTVENDGPSDSGGGRIRDVLPEGLTFLTSPDGCRIEGHDVICPVPPLTRNKPESLTRQFVARVASKASDPVENKACVESAIPEQDIDLGNDCKTSSSLLTQEADLAVSLDAPEVVELVDGLTLTYALTVTNFGPSEAADVTAELTLPPGSALDATIEGFPSECDVISESPSDKVHCDLTLPAGAAKVYSFDAAFVAPPTSPILASATVIASASVNSLNDKAEVATFLAKANDADLAVTKKAGVEAVVEGNLLRYVIEVTNHGPASASMVKIEDNAPEDGVAFVEPLSDPTGAKCETTVRDSKPVIACSLGNPLEKDQKWNITLLVKVVSDSDASDRRLSNVASVSSDVNDPNIRNNKSELVETPVLEVPPLILPFFEVANSVTTRVAVKNPSETPVTVDFAYYLSGRLDPVTTQSLGFSRKATHSEDIGAVLGFPNKDKVGYVGITPSSTEPPVLSGDFIRSEIRGEPGSASGLPLVSTDTSRVPPELCRRWSVRFLNGHSPASSTEFLFFVPGNQGGAITGRVYNENGDFVQNVSIIGESETSFRRTTEDEPVQGLDLLANFGSIEWELPEEVVGNVFAVHKMGRQYAVAVPGFCRDGDLGGASTLIVPYFEVDPVKESTTLLAVRNETESTMDVVFNYFSEDGMPLPLLTKPFSLAEHATQTVNLKKEFEDLLEQGRISGYVEIKPTGRASGDFIWIEPGRGASGGALVDASLDLSPRQLCQFWDARLVRDKAAGDTTDFVFYVDNPDKAMVRGRAYGCGPMEPVEVQRSRRILSLGLDGSCFVEWDFPEGVLGYVGAVFTSGGKSPVFVPGVCRQP